MARNLLHYLLSRFTNQVISIASQILLVPIFLSRWSPQLYGEWLALSSLPIYLGNLDFGMNMAATNTLTALYARGELDLYRRTQQSVIAYYLSLSAVSTLLISLVVWRLPIGRWLNIHDVPATSAALVVWLLAVQVLWKMPAGQIGNIFRCIGRASVTQWIANASIVIGLVTTISTVLAGGSLIAVALVQLIPLGVVCITTILMVRRETPDLAPSFAHGDYRLVRQLLKPSALFGLIMIAMALNIQAPILVIARMLGGTAVVAFATVRTLVNVARQVVTQINHTLEPEITRLYARQDFERLRVLHRFAVASCSTLSIAVAGALWFHGGDVVRLWTHGKVHVSAGFLHLMLGYVVLHVVWLASSTFSAATNKHRRLAWEFLGSNVLAVLFAILSVHRFGLNAIPIGLILGDVIACYHFVIRDTCHLCREPYAFFAIRTWVGLACVSAVALAAGSLSYQIQVGPMLLRWGLAGILTLGASAGTAWYVWFLAEDRKMFLAKWSQIRSGLLAKRTLPSAG